MCTSGWNHFIPSLRGDAETGTGSPLGRPADMARRERDRDRTHEPGATDRYASAVTIGAPTQDRSGSDHHGHRLAELAACGLLGVAD